MKSGIYQILNIINGKFYIGSAIYIRHRWQTHLWRLNKGIHQNKHLQASWNKYGAFAFEFQILEYCSKAELIEREQLWLDWTRACEVGYNIRIVANSNSGVKRSQETKDRQRLAMAGFRHSEATIAKMRIVQSNRSEQTKRKLSASKMGHAVSIETKAKIGFANKLIRTIKKEAELMFIFDKDLRNTLYV